MDGDALHSYDLNASFDDALGGPAIVSGGGTLEATGYSLDAADQGPSLSGPGVTDNYSIEMVVTLDSVSGFSAVRSRLSACRP